MEGDLFRQNHGSLSMTLTSVVIAVFSPLFFFLHTKCHEYDYSLKAPNFSQKWQETVSKFCLTIIYTICLCLLSGLLSLLCVGE